MYGSKQTRGRWWESCGVPEWRWIPNWTTHISTVRHFATCDDFFRSLSQQRRLNLCCAAVLSKGKEVKTHTSATSHTYTRSLRVFSYARTQMQNRVFTMCFFTVGAGLDTFTYMCMLNVCSRRERRAFSWLDGTLGSRVAPDDDDDDFDNALRWENPWKNFVSFLGIKNFVWHVFVVVV